MAAITNADWARIYAFIWLDVRTRTGQYQKDFEDNPTATVAKIAEKLQITYHDRLFEVGCQPCNPDVDPICLTDCELELIMRNEKDDPRFPKFDISMRMCC